MRFSPFAWLLAATVSGMAACGPAPSAPGPINSESPPAIVRTLRIATRLEPPSVASKPLRAAGSRIELPQRAFNAELSIYDDTGVAQPVLAEALPQLNTEMWRVLPDGRMQTSYRLRQSLTYHDGIPLSAEDFVFAWRVYQTAELGLARDLPQSLMEDVSAPDARTLVVRWTRPFPDAAVLNLPPLPRHILEAAFERGDANAFVSHPHWTREYVGLGPYRLTQWEPGSFIQGEAFADFTFGRPRIDRVHIRFINDANAALAALLAEDVHLLGDFAVTLEQLRVLKSDWLPRGRGSFVLQPDSFRQAMFQHRPNLVSPRALGDVRVRKAVAYTFDKESMNDAIYDGSGVLADSPLSPNHQYGRVVDSATVKYQYDPRQAERLMGEAGYAKAADGSYIHPADGPFAPELRTNASAQNEAEMHVLADGWRKAGIAFNESVTPTALVPDNEFRATFSGLYLFGGPGADVALRSFSISGIPTPENRWTGGNRGGWVNEEYTGLLPGYDSALDQGQRAQIAAQLVRIYSDQLPSIPMAFNSSVTVFRSELRGPTQLSFVTQLPWNIHEWQLA